MAKTVSAAQQTLIDNRAYGTFYLFSLELPSGTVYRTTWDQDISWNSSTWVAAVCAVQRGPVRNNASVTAAILFSANQLANQAIAFGDGVKGARVRVYEAFYDLSSLALADVTPHFVGVVRQVQTPGQWLLLACQQDAAMNWVPGRKYDKNSWGLFTSKAETVVIGNRTIVVEQENG